MKTLRKDQKIASLTANINALAVSDSGPCILESIHDMKSINSSSGQGPEDAGNGSGKIESTHPRPAINFTAFEIEDEIRRTSKRLAGLAGIAAGRSSEMLVAYREHLVWNGSMDQIDELLELTSDWCIRFEEMQNHGNSRWWGHPCPRCGALYVEGEVGQGYAPLLGGRAVVVGDWVVFCTSCHLTMSQSLSKTRARRIIDAQLGGKRLGSQWRKEAKEQQKAFVKANASYNLYTRQSDFLKANDAAMRTIELSTELTSGQYLELHGTPEEKAEAAAREVHTA